jgi:ADP-ribose pyrophosphatase
MANYQRPMVPPNAIMVPPNAKRVFEGQIFDVYQWPQILFDGSTATFEMLKRPDTVSAICITDNNIIVVNDEQPNREPRQTFPGGRTDPTDADALAAGRREVLEETGFKFKNWRLIAAYQPQTKIEWFVYTFLAWEGEKVTEPHLDAGERITVEHLSYEATKKLVQEKTGYLGESHELFMKTGSLSELLNLPEFAGAKPRSS